jgi:hypothetical protein
MKNGWVERKTAVKGADIQSDPRVETLRSLMDVIRLNRHALALVRALDAGDSKRVSDIVSEANKEGVDPLRLKKVCKAIRSDGRLPLKR